MTHRRRHGFASDSRRFSHGKSVDEIACDFGARGAVPACIAQTRTNAILYRPSDSGWWLYCAIYAPAR
ncbi:MAG: hypothetical protein AAFV93_08145 [Chloroflexota bacterium]